MDIRVVKKMNEVIAALKVVDRELASRSSMADKQKLIDERKPAIEQKMIELETLLGEVSIDPQTERYYRQLKEELNKVLTVTIYPKSKFL